MGDQNDIFRRTFKDGLEEGEESVPYIPAALCIRKYLQGGEELI